MPTVTSAEIDVDRREAIAMVAIANALHDAQLTEIQEVYLLARMLAYHTQRLATRDVSVTP